MPLRHEPAALVLSRQALPTLDRTRYAPASGLARGGYVLADPPHGEPQVILIATGSEVHVALGAYEQLTSEGIRARVVSLPCWELLEKQPKDYHDQVLPPHITARVAVEQATTLGWERFVGTSGAIVGMETFGVSAPLKALASKFGFTPETVARVAKQQIGSPPLHKS
jgi:transketolase